MRLVARCRDGPGRRAATACPAQDRLELPRVAPAGQDREVGAGRADQHAAHPAPARPSGARQRPQTTGRIGAHGGAARDEQAPHRAAVEPGDRVEHHIVIARLSGPFARGPASQIEVLARQDRPSAQTGQQLGVTTTGHRRDVCAQRLPDLHGGRSHATRGPVDQQSLAGAQLRPVAQSLQSRQSDQRQRRRIPPA